VAELEDFAAFGGDVVDRSAWHFHAGEGLAGFVVHVGSWEEYTGCKR